MFKLVFLGTHTPIFELSVQYSGLEVKLKRPAGENEGDVVSLYLLGVRTEYPSLQIEGLISASPKSVSIPG